MELIKAVQQVIYEEINEEKANQQDSDIELITKQDVIDKLHVCSTTLWILLCPIFFKINCYP